MNLKNEITTGKAHKNIRMLAGKTMSLPTKSAFAYMTKANVYSVLKQKEFAFQPSL